ncbi:NAD(P)-dependent oxidoreductase [Jeotgalibacillus soli]|uniref:NAD(P)-binding domain-containing protein n=1 Tax=Jeotgalibacillus soli TaxID=889306 RepID=A0A0C2VNK5_9BACL|nr:NAD(P)H-binding protein [Jeotgalibacillus soli]KIL45578.1 hypothetical protein KP78_19270 [Jeotgalibacillus soli]
MKIALFGGSGRVGSILLETMLNDGHEVSVISRKPLSAAQSRIYTIIGDATKQEDVFHTIKECDAVVSALGTDKNEVISKSLVHILNAMRLENVSKIITIGTAGIVDSKIEPGKFRFHSSESSRRLTTAAEDHCKGYLMLKQSKMRWTIVCPTYLPDGERIGNYRLEKNTLPDNPSSISIYDTADFAYSLLKNTEYERCRVGITY